MTDLASAIAASGGAPSAFGKDTPVGTTVTGRIIEAQLRQVTNFETGDPETWADGSPKQQVVVTIDTGVPVGDDGDTRVRIYIKWWGDQRRNLIAAIKNSGDTDLHPGGTFTATYTGDGEAPRKGFSAPKLYTYAYTPPKTGIAHAVEQQAAPAPAQPAAEPWGPPPTPADPALESKVAQMRGLGLTDAQIAAALGIDEGAVNGIPF